MDGSVGANDHAASVYDHTTQALLWYQSSAECRALYYQAYNTARLLLDNNLRIHSQKKKRAVIFDIDETILDDSPHSAMLLKQNKLFPYRYDEWIEAAKEPALPGALEFAKYAASRGVSLFYISNRTTKMMDATLRNLRSAGFPQTEESHVLLMGDDPSKESRRKMVAASYEIVLLLGDNLNDLSNAFEVKDIAGRSAEVDKAKSMFGSRYIVLPNPVYGAWESAVYGGKSNLSEDEKDTMRKAALKAFE
jgi:5'-nucleotidase (lipoprotein e(P4) family)